MTELDAVIQGDYVLTYGTIAGEDSMEVGTMNNKQDQVDLQRN